MARIQPLGRSLANFFPHQPQQEAGDAAEASTLLASQWSEKRQEEEEEEEKKKREVGGGRLIKALVLLPVCEESRAIIVQTLSLPPALQRLDWLSH